MAKRIAALRYPDIAMVLRFNFFFVVNICHELAHAFEQKCGHMWFDEQLEGGEVIDLSDPNWPNLPAERTQEAIWLIIPSLKWAWLGKETHLAAE